MIFLFQAQAPAQFAPNQQQQQQRHPQQQQPVASSSRASAPPNNSSTVVQQILQVLYIWQFYSKLYNIHAFVFLLLVIPKNKSECYKRPRWVGDN